MGSGHTGRRQLPPWPALAVPLRCPNAEALGRPRHSGKGRRPADRGSASRCKYRTAEARTIVPVVYYVEYEEYYVEHEEYYMEHVYYVEHEE